MNFTLKNLFNSLVSAAHESKPEESDQKFSNIRESIRAVELEPLPEIIKDHFNLTIAETQNVNLRRQFSVADTATLAFAKRGISFLHGAKNVILYGNHKDLTADEQRDLSEKLFAATENFLRELEAARPAFTIKGRVKEFERKQFQHYLATLNEILAKSLNKNFHETYKELTKAEQLASWHPRPIIATFNHYEGKSDRLIIERPMVTKEIAQQRSSEYPFSEYRRIPQAVAINYDENVVPEWFLQLDTLQQNWLIAHRQQLVSGELGCPPAIVRYVPGAANFTVHESYIKTDAGVDFRKVHRHSTARPIDMKKGVERDRLRDANGLQIVNTIDPVAAFNKFWNITLNRLNPVITSHPELKPFILERSLLSPLKGVDKVVHNQENNDDLAKDNKKAIEKGVEQYNDNEKNPTKVEALPINWPINSERGGAKNPFDEEHWAIDKKLLEKVSALLGIINPDNRNANILLIKVWIDNNILSNYQSEYSDRHQHLEKIKQLFAEKDNQIELAQKLGLIDRANQFDEEVANKIQKIGIAIQASAKLIELWQNRKNKKVVEGVNPKGRNRRLFVLGYEDLITQGVGGVDDDACKSSRDRAGTEEAHTDGMERCYLEEGFLPDFYDVDEKRDIFTTKVAEELINGHQQACSGENSDGADGIKDGKGALNVAPTKPMLPKDINKKATELRAQYLEVQDVLAKTNKPKIAQNPYAPAKKRDIALSVAAIITNIAGAVIFTLGMLGIIGLGWPVTIPLMVAGVISAVVLLNTTGMLKNNIKTDIAATVIGAAGGLVLHYFTFGLSSLAIVAAFNLAGVVKTAYDSITFWYRHNFYKPKLEMATTFTEMELKPEKSSRYECINECIKKELINNTAQKLIDMSNVDKIDFHEKQNSISNFLNDNQKTLGEVISREYLSPNSLEGLQKLLFMCFSSTHEHINRVGLHLVYNINQALEGSREFNSAFSSHLNNVINYSI